MPQSSHNQAAELHNLETHVRRRNCHLTRRLFGSMLRRMEALLLLAGLARQLGETNLDDVGELREGCL